MLAIICLFNDVSKYLFSTSDNGLELKSSKNSFRCGFSGTKFFIITPSRLIKEFISDLCQTKIFIKSNIS